MNRVLQQFLADHPGRDFDRGGLRLHYIDEGAGEPVVEGARPHGPGPQERAQPVGRDLHWDQ